MFPLLLSNKRNFTSHAFTVCAVVQAPAMTQAFIISVVVQSHSAWICSYHTWTLSTTKLNGLSSWGGHLQGTRVIEKLYIVFIYNEADIVISCENDNIDLCQYL